MVRIELEGDMLFAWFHLQLLFERLECAIDLRNQVGESLANTVSLFAIGLLCEEGVCRLQMIVVCFELEVIGMGAHHLLALALVLLLKVKQLLLQLAILRE